MPFHPYCWIFGLAIMAASVAKAGPITSTPDDDDDSIFVPFADPDLTLEFKAPDSPNLKDKSTPGGWGKLKITLSDPVTKVEYKIDPNCPRFMAATDFSDGMKTVTLGPGVYRIPVGSTVTVNIKSDKPVTFKTGVWKYKQDKPEDVKLDIPAAPVPEPATIILVGTAVVALAVRRRFSKP